MKWGRYIIITVFARSDATATKKFHACVPEVTNWVIEDRCQFLLANYPARACAARGKVISCVLGVSWWCL